MHVTDTYDYDAFGNKVNSTGTTPNNYLYRGEQWDPDLGLYYLRARYYNPLTGRFMSRDPKEYAPLESKNEPLDPARLNTYLYASSIRLIASIHAVERMRKRMQNYLFNRLGRKSPST
jgi:RHS repeat-associated protein